MIQKLNDVIKANSNEIALMLFVFVCLPNILKCMLVNGLNEPQMMSTSGIFKEAIIGKDERAVIAQLIS